MGKNIIIKENLRTLVSINNFQNPKPVNKKYYYSYFGWHQSKDVIRKNTNHYVQYIKPKTLI